MRLLTFHSVWAVLLLVLISVCAPVAAQTNSSMNSMLEDMGAQKGKGFDRSPISKPTSAQVNLNVHWRMWKRVHAAGEAGEEQLAALVEDGRSLGRTNQLVYATAVAALATSIEDYEVATTAFEGAEALAPQLPYPYLLHSSYVLEHDPARLPHWVKPWWSGVSKGALWPDTSYSWLLKLLAYGLLALGAGSIVFVFGQLLRNFGIVAYDLARLLPKGFSANQTALLLVTVVAVPSLVLKSPLVALLMLLALTTLVQGATERIISMIVFAVLASLPFADDTMSRLATFPRSVGQEIVHAQWTGCDAGCRESVDALAAEHPDDPYVLYTALLAAYRAGGTTNLDRVVEEVDGFEWPAEIIGYAHNLQGAAYVALAKPQKGLETLGVARDESLFAPSPPFNMMRAHQMLDDPEAAADSLQEAGARNLEVVAAYLDLERRDVNSFLIVDALPLRLLAPYHFHNPDPTREVLTIEPVWSLLAGSKVTFDKATLIGVAGMVLVLVGFPLRRRASTPCPRCGQARDPSEQTKTGGHAYCSPCYGTYVMGSTLDYDTRVHNEKVLGRRESFLRLMRRFSGLAVPGLGHHVAGHTATGFVITSLLVFCGALVLHPLGLVRAPHELVGTNWTGQVTIAWIVISVCLFSLLTASMRDLEPTGLSKGRR